MKKSVLALLVVMVLVTMSFQAFAAGKMTITQENFYVLSSWGIHGFAFAKVENTGNKPIAYNAGLLEVYDKNGDAIGATTYLSCYGKYLQPGEYAYITGNVTLDGIQSVSEQDDYSLTVSGQSNNSNYVKKLDCVAEYKPNEKSGYWTFNNLYATFTNDTKDVLYGVKVVIALLDKDENILDIETVSMNDSVGIWPGSKITVVATVSDVIVDAYKKAGFTADHVDAYAYVELVKE